MAERQETSVMASIQDILRDAKLREEQEKVEEDRRAQAAEQERIAAIRRQQEVEEAKMRAEEEERQRKAFEEQRRAAELAALQEAAIQKAKSEAEAQARMAEMAARQEHERHLHNLKHDKSKKVLRNSVIGIAALLVVGGAAGGWKLHQTAEHEAQIAAQLRLMQDRMDAAEAEKRHLKEEMENTKDPEKIAELEARLAAKEKEISGIQNQMPTGAASPSRPSRPAAGGVSPTPRPAAKPASKPSTCNCPPGDPMCSC